MSTITPEPKPADVDPVAGSLTLEPHQPDPADVPEVADLTDTADTIADTAALAGRLTGSTDLRTEAARMIAAGAPAEHVAAAVERTEGYTWALTALLDAVDDVVTGLPSGLINLVTANARLAAIEQNRDAA